MRISDWRSDVCSSDRVDLAEVHRGARGPPVVLAVRIAAGVVAPLQHVEGAAEGVVDQLRLLELVPVHVDAGLGQHLLEHVARGDGVGVGGVGERDGERSEEHTSELQSLMRISYAVFCLTKKKKNITEQAKSRDNVNK